jgi:predicted AAA+ superfamily ATPase
MLIKRTILQDLENHLTKPEITLITGPRQAGKTTLMEVLRDKLKKGGARTLFLNLDFETDRLNFSSQARLLQHLTYEIGKSPGYVFIDEIQRLEDAGLFLKALYDMKLPYKFIVSGSGSLELKEKIHESLPGRKRLFALSTLTFDEFMAYKIGDQKDLAQFFVLYPDRARQYFEEFLNFGGYPKVVLAETVEEKRSVMQDIFQSFLEKDITVLLHVKKSANLTYLVRLMASQIGNLVNVAELSRTLGLSLPTVKNYLWYLEKTFFLKKVAPYFKNVRKEITKASVYYFFDLGMRNFAANQFGDAQNRPTGFLFENFVFNLLESYLRKTSSTLGFWRTQDKAAVDFVIDLGKQVVPIEVKYSSLPKPAVSRSLRSFLAKYQPAQAYLINLSLTARIKIGRTRVDFIPFYDLKNCVYPLD